MTSRSFQVVLDFPGGSEVKASASNAGDLGLIPGSGRSPGEVNGNQINTSIFVFEYCAAKLLLSHFSHVQLCVTQWTAAHQAPLLMGFSRQEYWSGLPCPPPGDLPNPEIKPASLTSPALAGEVFTTSSPLGSSNQPYPNTK